MRRARTAPAARTTGVPCTQARLRAATQSLHPPLLLRTAS